MSRSKGGTEALNVDLTDNHGIASRPQGPWRQSPRSRHQLQGDRTQGFHTKGVTRMSPSALLRLETLWKCNTDPNWVDLISGGEEDRAREPGIREGAPRLADELQARSPGSLARLQ